jgi:uncharacterized alpha-E superfamily protein
VADAVRDQLSNDTWMVLSGLDRLLSAVSPERGWPAADDVSPTLARVLEALLAFAGLATESMVRDTGWWFLDAGRRLERAVHVTDLVRACLGTVQPPAVEELVVESVLVAAESIVTHRRRYPAGAGVDTVLELLLTDRDNPRSLAHQLDRLRQAVRHLPATDDDVLGDSVLRLRARLVAADVTALAAPEGSDRPALTALLDEIADQLRVLADAVATAHFAQPVGPRSFDVMLETV